MAVTTSALPRDWRVDTLRGYFLVIMTIAHLGPTPLMRFTEYTLGYASAPDGFVYLSGLVSGWVYLKILVRSGPAGLTNRALRRAGQIYLVQIALLTVAIAGTILTGRSLFHGATPAQALFAGALLIYQPSYSDILPMYCVFLLFTPIVLLQLMKGHTRLVIATSAALWTLSQFAFGETSSHVPAWIYLGKFNLLAWQAYFTAGLYLAWRAASHNVAVPKSRALLSVCAIVASVLFVDRHLHLIAGIPPLLKFHEGPSRNPARFLDTACLGYLIFWIPRVVDNKLKEFRIFQFLNFLGQHSLQVFAFSSLATFSLWWGGSRWNNLPNLPKTLIVCSVVLALTIPAQLHELYRSRIQRPGPTLLSGARSPVGLGVHTSADVIDQGGTERAVVGNKSLLHQNPSNV
jgi:hypothetical protein